ncbi:uncharacterized protein LOC113201975 isoform X2 [Frankliniella occidentalis]|uniref:Uncharacterized protein LOC113201975 isoform X2 n=1 Tax=Frankliniella occidentalis TaxID=133901 RepID=A0A6J1RTV2_FRAOC|nr:uncharacterized protein LOC113201975 isoform X2 [Frankliniella occidentalis]
MATRRSRIKAVANLPARRNRPLATTKTNENVDEGNDETSPPSTKVNENSIKDFPLDVKEKVDSPCKKSENITDSSSTPDRKSVIVTVEKDRKSVIVNRDQCVSTTKSLSADGTSDSCKEDCGSLSATSTSNSERLDGELTESHISNSELKSARIDEEVVQSSAKSHSSSEKNHDVIGSKSSNDDKDSSSQLEVVKEAAKVDSTSALTTDGAVTQSNRLPLRSRRTKPTVNLTAAARKRPASDLAVSSPCSPPPNKLKPAELLQRKTSEIDIVTTPGPNPEENNKQAVASDINEPSKLGGQASTPVPSFPETKTGKAVPDLPASFKVPASSPLKTKDNSHETACDSSNTLDKSNSSPQKESSGVKRKQSTNAQKVAAARKSLKSRLSTDGPLPRSSLTMFDLIFYNPSKNPMKSNDSSTKKIRDRLNSVSSVSSIQEDRLNEESVDDVDGGKENTNDDTEEIAMPVPQVKVGADGSLILDEQSLVIETTGTKKSREDLERSEVVVETGSSYGHYKKIIRSKDWSDHETKKFYRALNVVGTDFSLMKPYFRNRTRRELKLKFKKEEKLNCKLVNKALAEPLDFDVSELQKECELEDEEEKRLEELAKQKEAEKDKPCDVEEKAKKPPKKKKTKCVSAMAELLTEEEENSPGDTVVRKPPLKSRPRKEIPMDVKRDRNADADYDMLALGVNISDKKQGKQAFSNVDTKAGPGDLPAGTSRKISKTKKKIVPLSTSSNVDSEAGSVALFDLDEETPSNLNGIDGQDTNPQEIKTKQVTKPRKRPVKISSESTSKSCNEVPTKIIGASEKELPASVSNSQPSVGPGLRTPPTLNLISSAGTKLIVAPSHVNIPVQSTPMRIPPLVSIGMSVTPPNAIQVVQRSVLQTTPSAAPSSKPVSSPITNFTPIYKLPQSTPLRTVQVPGSVLPSAPGIVTQSGSKVYQTTPTSKTVQVSGPGLPSASCIVTSSGAKVHQSTPTSKVRTIQVTPQNVQNPASFSVTTPVSRLLPSTPTLPRMEPGSIIVLKTPLPDNPDRHVLQVYMVTNTPPGSSTNNSLSITPHLQGINLLPGPSVQPASSRSPCISDDSDTERVLTKL